MKKLILGLAAAMTALGLQAVDAIRISGGPIKYNGTNYTDVAQANALLGDEFPLTYSKVSEVTKKLAVGDIKVEGPITLTLQADYPGDPNDGWDNLNFGQPGGATYIFEGGSYKVSAKNYVNVQLSVSSGVTLKVRSGTFTQDPSQYLDEGYRAVKSTDEQGDAIYTVIPGVASYVINLSCVAPSPYGKINQDFNTVSELMGFVTANKNLLPYVTDLTLKLGQNVAITDTPFEFPDGKWTFVGDINSVTGDVDGKQLVISGGAEVVFDSGIFQVDPREIGGKIAEGRSVTYADGFWTVGEPMPAVSIAVDDEVILDAIEQDPAYSTLAYTLTLSADDLVLSKCGDWKVYVYLSNSLPVEVGTAAVGVKAANVWQFELPVAGDPSNRALIDGTYTLQQAMDYFGGKVSFAYKDIAGSLKGNTFTLRATLRSPDGKKVISSARMQYTFKHGYFGPAAEGEPLPVTGKDVLGYFTFDDESAPGKNAGVTASSISDFDAATITAGRFGGSAIYLPNADVRVAGTLVTGVEGRALPKIPENMDRPPQDNAHRLAGEMAWSVAFWFKPDPSVKPATWDDHKDKLQSEWAELFDGGWHHIVATFNPRDWVESANICHLYCDGGHWQGDVDEKKDGGWYSSWWGSNKEISIPLTVDPETGAFSLGGSVGMAIAGIPVALPLVGAIDDFIVFTRWLAADDVHCLYQTGDAYVTHVFPDVLDANGVVNSYKDWNAYGKYVGQLYFDNATRGSFDSNFGWSTHFCEHDHWQMDAPRACDDSAASEADQGRIYGYDTSFCDCLVAHNGEMFAKSQFKLDTFPGASLTLGRIGGNSGALYLYTDHGGSAERTIHDLRLNNGYIKSDSAKKMTLKGEMTVNAPATTPFKIIPDSGNEQTLVVEASIAGEADAGLTIGRGNENDDLTVMLAGDATEFKGTLDVTAGATLELPVAGESVEALTSYDGTQMQALAGEGWVKLVLADNVTLAEGEHLLAELPTESGSENRFKTNLENTDSFTMSVKVVADETTKVYLVVEEVEPPTPGEKPMVAEVTGGEHEYDGNPYKCSLTVTDPSTGWTAKWAWSDTDAFTNDDAMACIEVGVYTNIVKVTADGYYDFYGTGVVTITEKPLEKIVATVKGAEGTAGAGSFACELEVTKPESSYTAKWAWSDADDFAHDVPESYTAEGVYTNIVKVTADGYYDFYGTGIVTVAAAPLPPPVEPGEEIPCKSIEEANEVANTINDNKATCIKVPEGVTDAVDAEIYLGYLKARVEGSNNKVIVDLDADRKEELQAKLDEAFTAESVAGLSGAEAKLTVDKAIPGLYYWVEGGVEPNVIKTNGDAQQAKSEQKTLNLVKPNLGVTTKGFFKLAVGVAAPQKE